MPRWGWEDLLGALSGHELSHSSNLSSGHSGLDAREGSARLYRAAWPQRATSSRFLEKLKLKGREKERGEEAGRERGEERERTRRNPDR